MFDIRYNEGKPYWTVVGIRFSDYRIANSYAQFKAAERNNPVHIIQYEEANPAGFILETHKPPASAISGKPNPISKDEE